jgi:hypothetical protein
MVVVGLNVKCMEKKTVGSILKLLFHAKCKIHVKQ